MPHTLNLSRSNNLEGFINDNIEFINDGIKEFTSKLNEARNKGKIKFQDTDVKKFLKNKMFSYSKQASFRNNLIAVFKKFQCKKSEIKNIANKYVLYVNDLSEFYKKELFNELFKMVPDDIDIQVANFIKSQSKAGKDIEHYISKPLNDIAKKSLVLIKQNGFSNNIANVESGVQTANAGDSAQFLFVSRAILAGFNCSNVDVRSSRYDAIIDYKGYLFKVQVKGISGDIVSFKDRDRGGKGIDTHNERNIGKPITSKDCDLYVAVDKQVGICYIIPMAKFVDKLSDNEIKSYSVSKLDKYRENWDIIEELYNDLPDTATNIKKLIKENYDLE